MENITTRQESLFMTLEQSLFEATKRPDGRFVDAFVAVA
jgi:hypothetical protein